MIAILLATYNGHNRLSILIKSIINQSFDDWCLYIHDDGSTDNSLQICRQFQKQDSRIVILTDNIKHRGAKQSFMWLLKNVEADYYMFCDQDDLWLPFKIEQSYGYIKTIESQYFDKPICIHTDLAVCDQFYNITAHSLWKISKVNPDILENIYYLQVFNCVTGCTMLFNRKAKDVSLPFNEIAPMHDFWVAYSILSSGGILSHLKNSTILYCQHDSNAVGAINVGKSYTFHKLKNFKLSIKENRKNYQIMHQISGLSVSKYLWCKITYEIRRFL